MHGKVPNELRARKYIDANGIKHYNYSDLFSLVLQQLSLKSLMLKMIPNEIIIDFAESRITDMSAIDAVNKITERYASFGKKVHLKHLSSDCIALLKNAEAIIDVNIMEGPNYKVMTDKGKSNKSSENFLILLIFEKDSRLQKMF